MTRSVSCVTASHTKQKPQSLLETSSTQPFLSDTDFKIKQNWWNMSLVVLTHKKPVKPHDIDI